MRLRNADDAEAWVEFVRLYTPLVFGHCRRQGLQEADAADVAQEVMRAAAGALPDFEYDPVRGRFRAWLLQTTRHRLHQFFARRQRAADPASAATLERLLEGGAEADEQDRWESDYRQQVFDWAAAKARNEFQAHTWEAFWLTAVQEVSVKEAAARTSISVGAVYIARSRVMSRLREMISSVSDDPATWLES